jgi:acyl carrier protein
MAGNGRDVEAAVTSFIVENFLFGDAAEAPAPGVSLLDSGLVDSTGMLELVAFLERRYGFAVADHELTPDNLDSVTRVAAFVLRRTAGVDAGSGA